MMFFNSNFNTAFDELSKIHDALMNGNAMLQLHEDSDYTYNLLTKNVPYISVGNFTSDLTNESTDSYRVGVSPKAPDVDFMIEDCAGRSIPFMWSDIDELIVALQDLKEKNYKRILKSKELEDDYNQDRIKELEDELNRLKKAA